jgi:hypothetical protein
VWPEIEKLLEAAPGLEAVSVFETLRTRSDVVFSDGQLRNLQRRMRRWRLGQKREKEVMFPQEHRPGEAGQSDFTVMDGLGIRIAGELFCHLLYHFVLPHANWEAVRICFTESFESLVAGLQDALWEMGRVSRKHRTGPEHAGAGTRERGSGAGAPPAEASTRAGPSASWEPGLPEPRNV